MTSDQLDKEVTATLNSLQHLPHPEPDAFFYTRLKARMETVHAQLPFWMTMRFRWASLSVVALLFLLNSATVYQSLVQPSSAGISEVNGTQLLVEEYFQEDVLYYE